MIKLIFFSMLIVALVHCKKNEWNYTNVNDQHKLGVGVIDYLQLNAESFINKSLKGYKT